MTRIQIAALGSLLLLFSCKDNTRVAGASTTDPVIQKNIDATRAVNKAFETGNVTALDSVIADDFIDHSDRGEIKGRDSLKAIVSMVREHMKDMRSDVVKELADKDYVFSWMHFQGTSDGKAAPAGPFDMNAIEVAKMKDGKIVEHWEFIDIHDVMKMMGQGQPVGNMNRMDSTMMKK